MDTASPPVAACAKHPGQAAAFACARCGAFACEGCRSGLQPDLCESCAARVRAGEVRFRPAIREGLALAARTAPALLPVLLVQAGLKAAVSATATSWRAPLSGLAAGEVAKGLLAGALVSVAMAAADGVINAAADGLKILRFSDELGGARRPLSALAGAVARRYLVLAALLVGVEAALALLAVLCCVPAVLFGAVISFTEQEVLLGEQGLLGAFAGSYRLARRAFGRLCLLCAGNIAAIGLFSAAASLLIRTAGLGAGAGAGVRALFVSGGSTALAFVIDAVVTVLYLQLRPAPAAAPAR